MAAHEEWTLVNPSASTLNQLGAIDLSLMGTNWWTAINTTDPTKIRLYLADGSTRLPCGVRNFVNNGDGTGSGQLYYNYGSMSDTETQKLWIDPPIEANASVAASDPYGANAVFDENMEAAYALDALDDMTANSHDLTAVGGVTTGGIIGPFGPATQYDGVDDGHESAAIDLSSHQTVQVAFSLYWDAFSNDDSMAFEFGERFWANDGSFACVPNESSEEDFSTGIGNDAGLTTGHMTRPSAAVWHHYVITYSLGSPDVITIRMDKSAQSVVYDYRNSNGANYFGNFVLNLMHRGYSSGSLFGAGRMAHFHLHTTERSTAWHDLWYDHIHDNENAYTDRQWVPDGSGVTHEISVSDGIVFSDAVAKTSRFNLSVTDGVLASDYFSRGVRFRIDVQDGIKISDGFDRSASMLISVNDQVQFSDLPGVNCKFNIDVVDGVILSDHLTFGGSILISVTDGVVFSDSVSVVRKIWQTVTDNIIFSDSVSGTANYRLTIRDGVLFSDIISTAIKYLISVHDGIKLSDIVVDTTFLPKGEIRIEIISKKARIVFTSGKKPRIDFL